MNIDIKDRKTYRLIWLLALLANVLLVFTVFSQLSDRQIDIFLNSDALYLPSLYRDLILEKGGLQGWHLPPSLLILPDLVVYFLIRAVTGDFIIAGFVYGLVQYMVVLVFFTLIYHEIAPSADFLSPSVMMVLMSMFLLVSLFSTDFVFTGYLFLNGYHCGVFVMALVSLWLGLKYLKKPSKKYLTLLFVIITLSLASDLLYLLMFTIPFGAILLYRMLILRQEGTGKILITLGIASLSGYLVYWVLRQSGFIRLAKPGNILNPEAIFDSFEFFGKQIWGFLSAADFRSLIMVLAILSFFIQLALLLQKIGRKQDEGLVFDYLLFSVVFIPVVTLAPLLTGSYSGYDTLRYNIYAFYLSVANVALLPGLLSYSFMHRKVIRPFLLIALASIFTIGVVRYSGVGMGHYFNYYPSSARQADQIAEKHDLKKGVANFWKAKFITMFSKKDLTIYPVFDNLNPYYHLINQHKYYEEDAVFNFVVLDGINGKEALETFFGENVQAVDSSVLRIRKVPDFRYNRNSREPELIAR